MRYYVGIYFSGWLEVIPDEDEARPILEVAEDQINDMITNMIIGCDLMRPNAEIDILEEDEPE